MRMSKHERAIRDELAAIGGQVETENEKLRTTQAALNDLQSRKELLERLLNVTDGSEPGDDD